MPTSPSQRTLKYLRDRGWPHVAVVERWIPQAKRRKDLFGFCDVLALHPEWGHLYVQVTTGSHVNSRLYKMREFATQGVEDVILASNSQVEIHGWRQLKVGNRRLWKPRIMKVGLGELYDMNNGDWSIINNKMREVYALVETHGLQQGIFAATHGLHEYPPGVYIRMDVEAGHGDGRASRFTAKERVEASELAVGIVEKAMATYDWLELSIAYSPSEFSLGYKLRPRSYPELAEALSE